MGQRVLPWKRWLVFQFLKAVSCISFAFKILSNQQQKKFCSVESHAQFLQACLFAQYLLMSKLLTSFECLQYVWKYKDIKVKVLYPEQLVSANYEVIRASANSKIPMTHWHFLTCNQQKYEIINSKIIQCTLHYITLQRSKLFVMFDRITVCRGSSQQQTVRTCNCNHDAAFHLQLQHA